MTRGAMSGGEGGGAVSGGPGDGMPREGGGLVGVAIRQPVFTTMIMVGLMVMGCFSFIRLSIDEYPDVSIPILTVQTVYPGGSPEAVEQQVTRRIEEVVNTSQGIDNLTSTSIEGVSLVTVQFKLGTDINAATAEVRSRIEQVRRQMPPTIEAPVLQQIDVNAQPIVSLTLSSETRSLGELTALADGDWRRALESVSGVGRVQVSGGVKREIHVWLDILRMLSLGIPAGQVIEALQHQSMDVPAGRVEHGNDEYLVRVVGRARRPEDFGRIIVSDRGGTPVRIADVAHIEDGVEEQRSLALMNGRPAVGIDLMKVGGASTIRVADEVRAMAERLAATLPPDIGMTLVRDNSRNIRASVEAVEHELALGALLTVVIVFLFLNNARITAITALALPVSVISTFIVMHALGFTLNGMTLMALSLSIGLLIDDAIVVIESAVRHREAGAGAFAAAYHGTREIFLAVLASTLVIVAVFVPVAFMGGIVGRFFFEFGITVVWAILVSLFVSFTLTPMLAAWWLGNAGHGNGGRRRGWLGRGLGAFDRGFNRVARGYRGVVSWVLVHRKLTLVMAALSLGGALALFPMIGGSFMPDQDASEFSVSFSTPSSSSFAYTAGKAAEMDAVLRELEGVEAVYVTVGAGITGTINKGEIYVKLVPPKQRVLSQEAIADRARGALERVFGVTVSVSKTSALGGAQKPIQISVTGRQAEALGRLAEAVVERVKGVPGAIEVESSLGEPKPELRIEVDLDEANALHLDLAAIVGSIQPLLSGQVATTWRDEAGDERDVLVRLPTPERASAAQIRQLPIPRPGAVVSDADTGSTPLGQVAVVSLADGPSVILRERMARVATVSANVTGRSLGEVSKDIQAVLATVPMPEGYGVRMGGDTRQLQETAAYVMQAILLAVIMIYLILASQFGSFLQPLAIMFSVPLALVGVFLALLATGDTLNMMSMIGLIMLMGIVTKNAILLVDSANAERRSGRDLATALVHAGEVRLRPIAMTTMATIFGMIPIALGLGAGGEARAPMARAVIGGLVTSTLLTLLVVPVVYSYLEGFKDRLRRRREGRHGAATADGRGAA